MVEKSRINPSEIVTNQDGSFMVPSETRRGINYLVDLGLRYCSCHMGKLKGPCKHKKLVSEHFGIDCFDVIPTSNPRMRQKFMFLGTGQMMEIDWFKGLQDSSSNSFLEISPQNQIDQEVNQKVSDQPNSSNLETTFMEEMFDVNDDLPSDQTMEDDNLNVTEDPENHDDLIGTVDMVVDKLKKTLLSRIASNSQGYKKALKSFDKDIDNLSKKSDPVIQKALYSFGKTETQVLLSV